MRGALAALIVIAGATGPGVAAAQSLGATILQDEQAEPSTPMTAVDGWHAPGVSMFLPAPDARVTADLGDVTGFTPRGGGLQLDIAVTDTTTAFAPGTETIGLGVTYGRSFADVGVRMSSSIDLMQQGGGLGALSGSADRNDNTLGFGAAVDLGRFTLGGSIDHGMSLDAERGALTAWDVGVGYEAGPWGLSLSYSRNQVGLGDTLSTDLGGEISRDQREQVTLGFNYRLADGVDVGAFGAFVGGPDGQGSDGLSGGDRDVQGFVVGSGVEIDF